MPDSLEALADSLDIATADGHLPNPAQKVSLANQNDQDSSAFVRTIRRRLIALGYLGSARKNKESTGVDARFIKAVRKFQGEALLNQDSWVGPATWEKLQQLVSFEENQEPAEWHLSATNTVVLRALYLRLYILGFMDWNRDQLNTKTKIGQNDAVLLSAFSSFLQVCKGLGMIPNNFDSSITLRSLGLVFGQDELIKKIDDNTDFLKLKENSEFLIAIARVELWMLGYDARVGKPGKSSIRALNRAMIKFWQDNQDSPYYPSRREVREGVSSNFFRELAVQDAAAEDENENRPDLQSQRDQQVQQRALEHIDTLSDDEQVSLQGRVKSITSSIWDGVKRLFRWLRKIVKKVIAKAANLLKNLARLIARSSRNMFEVIAKAIDIFHRGVVFMKHSTYKKSQLSITVIRHDKDFDQRVFVNESSRQSERKEIVDGFLCDARAFQAACRLMGHLISIFKFAIEVSSAGILGWFILLTSLSKMYSRIETLVQEIKDIALLDVLDHESLYSVV